MSGLVKLLHDQKIHVENFCAEFFTWLICAVFENKTTPNARY